MKGDLKIGSPLFFPGFIPWRKVARSRVLVNATYRPGELTHGLPGKPLDAGSEIGVVRLKIGRDAKLLEGHVAVAAFFECDAEVVVRHCVP